MFLLIEIEDKPKQQNNINNITYEKKRPEINHGRHLQDKKHPEHLSPISETILEPLPKLNTSKKRNYKLNKCYFFFEYIHTRFAHAS